jgi:hypothetical protein
MTAGLTAAWQRDRWAEILPGAKAGLVIGIALLAVTLPPADARRAGRATTVVPALSSSLARPAAPVFAQAQPVADEPMLPLATLADSRVARRAGFGDHAPTPQARWLADWVADSNDNKGLPFAILDKRARVFVFDADAQALGSSLVLLGSATGDDTVAGVGNKALAALHAEERTTPAGRFVAVPGHDETGDDVVWVDYDSSVAMHRVKIVDPKEHRFERIATPTAADKRISNGCINVPIEFYDAVVKPALGRTRTLVYVLPELKSIRQVFPNAYDVNVRDTEANSARVDRTVVLDRPGAVIRAPT